MGVETAVIPTAVLSTHTAFKGFTFCDLTDEIAPITAHWKREGITFDAIYTGYLGSQRQLNLVSELFRTFRPENGKIVIDPVMADNGALYPGFTVEFAAEMAKLCGQADVILPNITEACYLLGVPYKATFSEEEIREILVRLTSLGCKTSVLTGVSLTPGRLGAMSYNAESKQYFYYDNEYLPVSFHGTGDIFASTVTGALALGRSIEEALTLAVDYTFACMKCTMQDPDHRWYGVNFESAIPALVAKLQKN